MEFYFTYGSDLDEIHEGFYDSVYVGPRPTLTHDQIDLICSRASVRLRMDRVAEMDVAYFASRLPSYMTELYMDDCPVGDLGAAALARGMPEDMVNMTLMRCGITEVGARALASAVPTHPHLQTLQVGIGYMRPIVEAFLARRSLLQTYIAVPRPLRPRVDFGNGVRYHAERVWALYSGPSWARRFFRDQDGDHAVAYRVMQFLAG